eukprot:8758584-Alexandrium_andersonii.AAC.1
MLESLKPSCLATSTPATSPCTVCCTVSAQSGVCAKWRVAAGPYMHLVRHRAPDGCTRRASQMRSA